MDVQVDALFFNLEVLDVNQELENVEFEIGVIFPVDILCGIALLSPAVGCCGRDLIILGYSGDDDFGGAEHVVHQ